MKKYKNSKSVNLPGRIELSPEEAKSLLQRVEQGQLTEEDRALCKRLLEFSLWLQQGLESSSITTATLRKVFGLLAKKKIL